MTRALGCDTLESTPTLVLKKCFMAKVSPAVPAKSSMQKKSFGLLEGLLTGSCETSEKGRFLGTAGNSARKSFERPSH